MDADEAAHHAGDSAGWRGSVVSEELLLKQAAGGNIAAIIFERKAANPAKDRDNHRLELSGPNAPAGQLRIAGPE